MPNPLDPPIDYRGVIDAHAILSITDAAGRIVEVNEPFCAISGYRADELVGRDYRLLNSGFHPHEFFAGLWASVSAGRSWRGRLRNRRKDGGFYWVDESILPCLDADGRPFRYVAIGHDVTALVDAEEEAVLQERRTAQAQSALAQIVQNDPVATFVINARHQVTHWNASCEIITGIAAADMIGTSDQWRPFYPEARPVLADLIVKHAQADEMAGHYSDLHPSATIPGAFEAEGFFPGCGTTGRWLFFTAAPLRDLHGKIIGAIETLQDVTERRFAEEALHAASAQLEVIVEQRTAELQQANAQLAEDVRQREVAEAELLRRYAELTELNCRLNDMQEQLLQSEKLASIGQLAAGVAHEINNPIGFVNSNIGSLGRYLQDLFRILDAYAAVEPALADAKGYAEVQRLKAEIDLGFLREDLKCLLDESRDGIGRVRKIVQDLKDFSRVDSSQEWQLADLRKGIESTLNVVNNEIKYKADVVREYGDIPEIECLPSQLNQVFMNLLVNAAHAIGDGSRGTVTLRTGTAGEKVWVEIADNGCGIAPENINRIFEPFFTTKPVGKGTGLGLSLSYGIVKKHGGDLAVTSEVGKGTTFRITLPRQQPPADRPR